MSIILYIAVMAGVTYLVRMIPFTLFRKQIKSRYIRSMLYYLPYAVLSAMTIPAIFYSTGNLTTAIVGTVVAVILAFFDLAVFVQLIRFIAGVEKILRVLEEISKGNYDVHINLMSLPSSLRESAKKLMPQYTELLVKEIEETGRIAKELGLKLESVYYGGGTPTALTEELLKRVTDAVSGSFDLDDIKEYTIEAGRPDSVTEEKFRIMKSCGCNRISINPQTFNDDVLKEIGRNHTSAETLEAMKQARKEGFDFINMDLIAGLPTDTLESYKSTLDTVLSLEPENITVHTLALKRSATLVTDKRETNSGGVASAMVSHTYETLTNAGYIPYYMYRQSKSLGNLENVGWAKEGFEGLYNVYMMEECHTILSVGAGAVTKLKNPHGNEIERIFNYKYPYEYINDFDEIIKRKKQITEFYMR